MRTRARVSVWRPGGRDTVLEQIDVLRDCGVGVIDMALGVGMGQTDYDRQDEVMERFAAEILPEIRSW